MVKSFTDSAHLVSAEGEVLVEVPLTICAPDGAARGGIVVLHESRELTDAFRELLVMLSDDGWFAVAPNLFHRDQDPGAEVFGSDLFEDFDAAWQWLTEQGVPRDLIGVLGFDDAGTAAALVATDRPVGAAVSVAAPGILEPLTTDAEALVTALPSLKAPWLGLYGEDERIPSEQIEQLQDAAATASVAVLVVQYTGYGHRADYENSAVPIDPDDDTIIHARSRIFDWFNSHLR
ncbi:dienelactone hydrolase family protein [Millisia brevis]|uniref:dienelactone hydrolase family protein n=1 Tax=Millisia brevis TaxID=264148 RepID=UPI00083114DE|nr:dienelactone hydrolase family protein [Millisia brevis]